MLVLSRRAGEAVVIKTSAGEVIRVTLVNTKRRGRSSASIGFEASDTVQIDREEIADQKEKERGKNPH